MSRIDWTEILLKLLALMNVLGMISAAPSIIGLGVMFLLPAGTVDNSVGWVGYLSLALLFLVPIVVTVVIWKNAQRIAAWLWRGKSEESTKSEVPATFAEVKVAAFSGIGLYILVISLPTFIKTVVELVRDAEMYRGYPEATLVQLPKYAYAIGQVVQFILATVLVVSPQRVVRFLDRMWSVGAREDSRIDKT